MSAPASDRTPLLTNDPQEEENVANNGSAALATQQLESQKQEARKRSGVVNVLVTFLFITAIVVSFTAWNESLSSDPHKAALSILNKAPVIVSTSPVI